MESRRQIDVFDECEQQFSGEPADDQQQCLVANGKQFTVFFVNYFNRADDAPAANQRRCRKRIRLISDFIIHAVIKALVDCNAIDDSATLVLGDPRDDAFSGGNPLSHQLVVGHFAANHGENQFTRIVIGNQQRAVAGADGTNLVLRGLGRITAHFRAIEYPSVRIGPM